MIILVGVAYHLNKDTKPQHRFPTKLTSRKYHEGSITDYNEAVRYHKKKSYPLQKATPSHLSWQHDESLFTFFPENSSKELIRAITSLGIFFIWVMK